MTTEEMKNIKLTVFPNTLPHSFFATIPVVVEKTVNNGIRNDNSLWTSQDSCAKKNNPVRWKVVFYFQKNCVEKKIVH